MVELTGIHADTAALVLAGVLWGGIFGKVLKGVLGGALGLAGGLFSTPRPKPPPAPPAPPTPPAPPMGDDTMQREDLLMAQRDQQAAAHRARLRRGRRPAGMRSPFSGLGGSGGTVG